MRCVAIFLSRQKGRFMRITIYNDWDLVPKATASGEEEAILAWDGEYRNGDVIEFSGIEAGQFYVVSVDPAVGEALVYITADTVRYKVPFYEKKTSYNPLAFTGNRHYVAIRRAEEREVRRRRNLALNPFDQHEETVYDGTTASHRAEIIGGIGTITGEGTGAGGRIVGCPPHVFPHASANVETRGEAVFQARNAIDGVKAATGHGEWPYESWGINRQDDAEFMLEFGRPVDMEEIRLYTRADFPHDNWWREATFTFSDGTKMTVPMEKLIQKPHIVPTPGLHGITWLKLGTLIRADDPSPFPALTQIEVYGRETGVSDLL
jgi:hypothetical protein